ncbi:MAG: tRNA methyltransferase, partial [Candidatus Woesearchaeota archaeon]
LVYSTCTLEPEENEGVVSWLLEKEKDARLNSFELDIKKSDPVLEFDGRKFHKDVKKCLRIYPQDNNTEGFFVAKIEKT